MTYFTDLCDQINANFGGNVKIYGEGHEVITPDGTAFWSIAENEPCAVDDNYDLVLFWVRNSADATDQILGGRKTRVARRVRFTLAGNSSISNAEQRLASIVNGIKDLEYISSDFATKAIASNFFGIEEQNFETYFFTIDFLALEKIDCPEC